MLNGGLRDMKRQKLLNVLALMYDSGLGQAEVCGMEISDVRFDERYAIVRSKGDKERQADAFAWPSGYSNYGNLSAFCA